MFGKGVESGELRWKWEAVHCGMVNGSEKEKRRKASKTLASAKETENVLLDSDSLSDDVYRAGARGVEVQNSRKP